MIQDLAAIWKFRYFWLSLVKMDLLTRYRKSVLGVLWSLLHPLGMTAIFCLVFSKLIGANWEDYSKYLLAGMAAFNFLRDCTLGGCQSLLRHEGYIRQAPLPFQVYSLRVMLSNGVHFLITLGVLVLLVAALPAVRLGPDGEPRRATANVRAQVAEGTAPAGVEDPPAVGIGARLARGDWAVFGRVWQVVPGLVLVMIFGWALATITGFATVYFHDISHLLELFAQFLFFATPVMWTRKLVVGKGYEWLVDFNPAAAFIDLFRLPLVYAEMPDAATYGYASLVTATAVGVAALMVSKLSKRVIFQM